MQEINKVSFALTHPELVKDWDLKKNKSLTPSDVFSESHKRVWWICESKHENFEPVRVRVFNMGCSQCKNEKRKAEMERKDLERRIFEGSFNDYFYNPELKLRDILGSNVELTNTTLEEVLGIGGQNQEVRIYNCLKRMGINTLDQVLECDYDKLSRVRNFGIKSQIKLYEILKQYVNEEQLKV